MSSSSIPRLIRLRYWGGEVTEQKASRFWQPQRFKLRHGMKGHRASQHSGGCVDLWSHGPGWLGDEATKHGLSPGSLHQRVSTIAHCRCTVTTLPSGSWRASFHCSGVRMQDTTIILEPVRRRWFKFKGRVSGLVLREQPNTTNISLNSRPISNQRANRRTNTKCAVRCYQYIDI